jgi:hypothetical protein
MPKTKIFYQIDEACERLGLSALDIAVLVAEGKVTLSTAVGGLLVEEGAYEEDVNGQPFRIPEREVHVRGLVDLLPHDGWHALRHGSQVIFWLASDPTAYRRLVSRTEEDRGHTILREELGLRHEELVRLQAQLGAADDAPARAGAAGRPSNSPYEWEAARLEACRWIYFEGVPASFGALIRHVQAWFAARGGKVPDESTLKRRLRDIWATFAPEAKPGAAREATAHRTREKETPARP